MRAIWTTSFSQLGLQPPFCIHSIGKPFQSIICVRLKLLQLPSSLGSLRSRIRHVYGQQVHRMTEQHFAVQKENRTGTVFPGEFCRTSTKDCPVLVGVG